MHTNARVHRRIAILRSAVLAAAVILMLLLLQVHSSAQGARDTRAARGSDDSPPVVSITSSISATTAGTRAVFEFSSTATDIARYECSVDGAAYATCTSPRDLSSLAPGGHTFAVRGVDTSGNVGAAALSSWSVSAGGSHPHPLPHPADAPDEVVSVSVARPAAVVRPSRLRYVTVARIACHEATGGRCAVVTSMVSSKPIDVGGRRVRVAFGAVRSNVVGGAAMMQRLQLSSGEARLVRRLGALPVTATTVTRDASGNALTSTRHFVLAH